jgi:DNA-binding NarL/FixJ family response regulator
MISGADAWGPFRPDIDPAERMASLRCLRAVVHLSTSPRGQALTDLMRRAEQDPALLPPALAALNKPDHRPVAERRSAVEALSVEGLSDREIARQARVSPSTVAAVRKALETARFGA